MTQEGMPPLDPKNVTRAFDENPEIMDDDILPIHPPIKVLRYRTVAKSISFGWWSAVALVEDHGEKQICFYRWRKKGDEWKRVKKMTFRKFDDWAKLKDAVETFLQELEG